MPHARTSLPAADDTTWRGYSWITGIMHEIGLRIRRRDRPGTDGFTLSSIALAAGALVTQQRLDTSRDGSRSVFRQLPVDHRASALRAVSARCAGYAPALTSPAPSPASRASTADCAPSGCDSAALGSARRARASLR